MIRHDTTIIVWPFHYPSPHVCPGWAGSHSPHSRPPFLISSHFICCSVLLFFIRKLSFNKRLSLFINKIPLWHQSKICNSNKQYLQVLLPLRRRKSIYIVLWRYNYVTTVCWAEYKKQTNHFYMIEAIYTILCTSSSVPYSCTLMDLNAVVFYTPLFSELSKKSGQR